VKGNHSLPQVDQTSTDVSCLSISDQSKVEEVKFQEEVIY